MTKKMLAPVKLWLSIEVLNQVMGQWVHQETSPVPTSFYVVVLRGQSGSVIDYSVSTETGLTESPMPLSNGRVEFTNLSSPSSFGVSSPPVEKDGKKYISELRIADFHGRIDPAKK